MLKKVLGVLSIVGDFTLTGAGAVITACGIILSIADVNRTFPAESAPNNETTGE